MIREKLIEREVGASSKFRLRGREVSRIKALSDAVFGFAITLLVVSLEVPQTFSIGLASRGTPGFVALAGFIYMLIGPVMTVDGWLMGKKRKRLEATLLAANGRAAETELTPAALG